MSHVHYFANDWSLISATRAQFANKNLDSSARMSLGGPSGVRGFPVSEASGDEGLFASVGLARPVGERLNAGAFVDWGRIHINESGTPAVAATPNWYNLAATGINAEWRFADNAAMSFVVARPITGNPGADANGRNADGKERGTRAWLSISANF